MGISVVVALSGLVLIILQQRLRYDDWWGVTGSYSRSEMVKGSKLWKTFSCL